MYRFFVLSKSILYSLIGLKVLVVGLLIDTLVLFLSGEVNSYLWILSPTIFGDKKSLNLSKSIA